MGDFFEKYAEIRGDDYVKNLQLEGEIAAQIKTKRQELKMSQQKLANFCWDS